MDDSAVNEQESIPAGTPLRFRCLQAAWSRRLAAVALAAAGMLLVLPWQWLVGVPVLLLLAALLADEAPDATTPLRDDWLMMVALGLYGLTWLVMAQWHGESGRGVAHAWPFALAIAALVAFAKIRVTATWLWAGLALGSLAGGGWAGWQKLIEGSRRVEGHEPFNPILYGNFGLLLGLLCLAGLGWAWTRQARWRWSLLLVAGGLAGLLTSALSGTRGGWIGLPLAAWLLYRGHARRMPARWRLGLLSTLLVLVAAAYLVPQTGVAERVENARVGVERFLTGDDDMNSISARVAMWRGAAELIGERPMSGWGMAGYRSQMIERSEEGLQPTLLRRFWHAHNDVLDAWVKLGLPGLAALLCLYFMPLWLFARGIGSGSGERRSLAVAGTLLSVAFIGFGLTYSLLAYPAGGWIYALLLVVVWGLYRQAR